MFKREGKLIIRICDFKVDGKRCDARASFSIRIGPIQDRVTSMLDLCDTHMAATLTQFDRPTAIPDYTPPTRHR